MSLINPVIVLPGITGSSLRDEYPIDPERVWSLINKQFDRTMLHPNNLRYELKEPSRVAPDNVFNIPYSEFIEELRHNLSKEADKPTPVFPFAYDWRQPLEAVENQLERFIDEVIARTKLLPHYHAGGYGKTPATSQVNLVGHSMGGLIIAGYIAKHGGSKVGKVASLGSPFRGSHEAILKVATGLAAWGSSTSSSREREAARMTPALYHLIPSYEGAIIADGGLSNNLFHIESWQPGVIKTIQEFIRMHGLEKDNLESRARELFSAMLGQAKAYRDKIERLSLSDAGLKTKDWLCVVGVGEATRVRLRIQNDNGKPLFNLTSDDRVNEWDAKGQKRPNTGDGTVPYMGARCSFISTNEVVCVCDDDFGYWEILDRGIESRVGLHGLLPEMNLVQRLVVSHFQGEPEGKVWGRPAPDLKDEPWNPPIKGLRNKG